MDNAPGIDRLRQWRADLLTGTVTSEIDVAEDPRLMDSVFPDEIVGDDFSSIFVKRGSDERAFRFYLWASVIRDGQIVATDYAPDVGWLQIRPPDGGAS
jgi:hypothetical protein